MSSEPTYDIYRPHPSLTEPISPAQRDSATRWLSAAYADGRMNKPEFDLRLEQALAAQTRGEMDVAFAGLTQEKLLDLDPPGYRTGRVMPADTRRGVAMTTPTGTAGALLAHLSSFFLWFIGPVLVRAFTAKGSFSHKEAAKAFNWQLASLIGFVVVGVVTGVLGRTGDHIGALVSLLWFVLTVIGCVKAAQGQEWTNPVMRVLHWHPMDEKV